jgi:hypothetical protein
MTAIVVWPDAAIAEGSAREPLQKKTIVSAAALGAGLALILSGGLLEGSTIEYRSIDSSGLVRTEEAKVEAKGYFWSGVAIIAVGLLVQMLPEESTGQEVSSRREESSSPSVRLGTTEHSQLAAVVQARF